MLQTKQGHLLRTFQNYLADETCFISFVIPYAYPGLCRYLNKTDFLCTQLQSLLVRGYMQGSFINLFCICNDPVPSKKCQLHFLIISLIY